MEKQKRILDVCCGGRTFYFDKENQDVIFHDRRVMQPEIVGSGKNARTRKCLPDVVGDFRDLKFESDSFHMVVFDPPHLKTLGEGSYMIKMYGKLDPDTWKEDLRAGFSECFRVLKESGTLIFKWNEYEIPLREVLKLTDRKPVFGHPSGKQQKTHWVAFIK